MRGPNDANVEVPLFIDPGNEDPEKHIAFDEGEIVPHDESPRGDRTIRLLELTRSELNVARRTWLDPYRLYVRLARSLHDGKQHLPDDDVGDICSVLAAATLSSAPFAGMMRSYLRRHFGADIRLPLTLDELLVYVRGGQLPRRDPTISPAPP